LNLMLEAPTIFPSSVFFSPLAEAFIMSSESSLRLISPLLRDGVVL
jgi:hypothetical protein